MSDLVDIFGPSASDSAQLAGIFGTGAPDFSDVTDGATSTADDARRRKRAELAAALAGQRGAPNAGLGAVPAQSVGDRVTALGDRAVSAAADGIASLPEMAAKGWNAYQRAVGGDVFQVQDEYPTLGTPGGFLDLKAQREDIHRQADAARERLLGSEGDPGVVAAADTLGEAAGMAIPLPGLRAARAAEELAPAAARETPLLTKLFGPPAADASKVLLDEAPGDAAFLANRAKVMATMPGGEEPFVGPGAVADALAPRGHTLQVGRQADNAAQDIALGLRAPDPTDPALLELQRASLPIGETPPPTGYRFQRDPGAPAGHPDRGGTWFSAEPDPATYRRAGGNSMYEGGQNLVSAPMDFESPALLTEPHPGPRNGPSHWVLAEHDPEFLKMVASAPPEGQQAILEQMGVPSFEAQNIVQRNAAYKFASDRRAADILRGQGHDGAILSRDGAPAEFIDLRPPTASAPLSEIFGDARPDSGSLNENPRAPFSPPIEAPASMPVRDMQSPPPTAETLMGPPLKVQPSDLAPIDSINVQQNGAVAASPLTTAPQPAADAAPTLRNLLTREEVPLDTPTTSTKNAVTTAERFTRDLPEVEALARKSTGDTWAEARQIFDADPESPRLLAQRIAQAPRTLTPVENDLLLHDRMKLSLDHRETLGAEEAALQAGDTEGAALAKIRRTSIESAMDVNDTAVKRSGTEWSAAGSARQKLIAEDYSPLYLRQRLTVAARESGAAEIPGAADRLTEISRQLEEAHAQLATYEQRLSETRAAGKVRAAQGDVAAAERSGVRRAARQDLDAEYQDLASQLEAKARRNQSTVNMSGGLDPETVAIIGKMARNRVQAGARGLGDVVDGIYQTIRPHLEGLEPSEVRDAISGYGVVRPQATRAEAVAELARIRQQARLVAKLDALEAGEALPAARPRPAVDPGTAALQEKLRQVTRDLDANPLRSDAQRLAATQERLEARISDAERGVGPRAPRAPLADTPGARILRQKLRETLDYHGLGPESPARAELTDPQRLAALRRRLSLREEELTKQVAEEYFPKKARRPLALDSDAIALQGRVNALKQKADLIIRKQELAGRSGAEKAMDFTAGWSRFIKLIGTPTLQKISSAAAERSLIFRPIEEVLGAGWSKAPLVKHFAAAAPIEGGGSLDAVAKSYAGFFGKAARREMAANFAGKEGPMELALSTPHLGGEVPEWMSYPGRVHAGLKAPAKIAGYEYAIQKQAEHYLRLGQAEKLADPGVVAEMKAAAWEYAHRDIFLGDNFLVNKFRKAFSDQPGQSAAEKFTNTAANVMLPIVKVPTNYVGEVTDYLGGLGKAGLGIHKTLRAGRAALAKTPGADDALVSVVKAGLDALPPGQAERIMRQLKKGSLGAGLVALGATGVVKVGGYYDGPRADSDLQPGQIEIAGHAIPHMILHHPALEALQVGGTLFRAKTASSGAWDATKGLAEQIPFVETYREIGKDVWGREPTKAAGAVLRGISIPPDAQRLARVFDQKGPPKTPSEQALQELGWVDIHAKKRKPHGSTLRKIGLEEELGIPGLRDNVR